MLVDLFIGISTVVWVAAVTACVIAQVQWYRGKVKFHFTGDK